MIPERIPELPTDLERICAFAAKWRISSHLAYKLAQLDSELPFGLQIISGYRDQAQAAAVGSNYDTSTHSECPATGADIWVIGTELATAAQKAEVAHMVGMACQKIGLRWGGSFQPIDPEYLYNLKEWNHVDLGPRS